MYASVGYADRAKRIEEKDTKPVSVSRLVSGLCSIDGSVRRSARHSLVAMGAPAVTSLIGALADRNDCARWEAAKALGEIGDPSAAGALVKALEDEDFDIRWLAAEGLIKLRRNALAPLMRGLIDRSNSVWLREGARHVLHRLASNGLRSQVEPVLKALDGMEPGLTTPMAALLVLESLSKTPRRIAR